MVPTCLCIFVCRDGISSCDVLLNIKHGGNGTKKAFSVGISLRLSTVSFWLIKLSSV